MRVVVDTNILVSFAIRPNKSFEKIFDYIAVHGIALVSEDTIAELIDVLNCKKFRKYIALSNVTDYVEWYVAISETVVVAHHVVACRDPKDDKILSLAVAGRADCIIAGDRDLLDMAFFAGILIYNPEDFRRQFVRK
jgi:putative PIN family toxin of toxin-antitoxin system